MSLRCLDQDSLEHYNDNGIRTHTSDEQKKVERSIETCFQVMRSLVENSDDNDHPKLSREKHVKYLRHGLFKPLPHSYACLDASRPWLTYWITHSLAILEDDSVAYESHKLVDFLSHCSNASGGYGGGPGQISHLATTYAAVNAIVSIANEDALKSINREQLKNFLMSMKQKDGSFRMHLDGEVDVRGAYCAASVATLTGIDSHELFQNTTDWIVSCQSYEGGFSGFPGGEAHGGYTFCAIAALVLLNGAHKCDLKALLRWVVNRQQRFEGGFAGRTNKLVDGCYSFWQGAILQIVHAILTKESPQLMPINKWLFNQQALQEYLLCCCQETNGGLVDKPTRSRDYYHTCYDLSGLSVSQHSITDSLVIGNEQNRVAQIHPIYNITVESVKLAIDFYSSLSK